jgi:L-fucose isomerase-like protein
VELLPLDMVDFLNAMRERAAENRAAYEAEVAELRRRYTVEGFDTDEPLVNVLAARDEMLALAEAHALDGLTLQSFMSVVDAAGAYCTYAESCVCERLPYGAETDVHGVISDLLLRRAMFGAAPAYLAEFTTRHPDHDNAVLLWHAAAPLSMCDPADAPAIGHHWILPSPLSGMLHFKLREGPITVARFDGDHGEYRLAVGEGHTVPGPRTLNNYVWMEVDDWPSWERTLMQGPFIHHCAMGYGHYADALTEACKYVPGLEAVRLGAR